MLKITYKERWQASIFDNACYDIEKTIIVDDYAKNIDYANTGLIYFKVDRFNYITIDKDFIKSIEKI